MDAWAYSFESLGVHACSNIYLLNDHLNKREWTYIFGACCMMTIFIPSFRNYRIWSFFGLIMITYTAWYMTIASVYYGQVTSPNHPHSSIPQFTLHRRTSADCFLIRQMFHNHTRLSLLDVLEQVLTLKRS